MVLVLFFCTLLIFITIFFFLIIFSTLKIDLENFQASNLYANIKDLKNFLDVNKNQCKNKKIINDKYKAKISINLLGKFKIFQVKLNSEKIKKIKIKMHLDRIDIKELEKNIGLADIKEIMQVNPKISYMDLNIKVGIDDVVLTTYIVPIISTIISILLPLLIEKDRHNNIKYLVEPIYNKRNVYDVSLNIGIKIKVIKLLNVIYAIYKNKKISKSKNIIYKGNVTA